MSMCEWNPVRKRPSEFGKGRGDCLREAAFTVGPHQLWLLCEECSRLPHFDQFRERVRLPKDVFEQEGVA